MAAPLEPPAHSSAVGARLRSCAGLAPTSRKVSIQEVAIFRLVGGKIVEQWGMPAIHDLTQQLGATNVAKPPAESTRCQRRRRSECRGVRGRRGCHRTSWARSPALLSLVVGRNEHGARSASIKHGRVHVMRKEPPCDLQRIRNCEWARSRSSCFPRWECWAQALEPSVPLILRC